VIKLHSLKFVRRDQNKRSWALILGINTYLIDTVIYLLPFRVLKIRVTSLALTELSNT
jgi:hypothetical protein